MGVPNDNLQDLERQRLELETNIRNLEQSLYHWRTWEAEYEGLKEGIQELDEDATTEDFLFVSQQNGGKLVNEDEVRVIIGEKQGLERNKEQVVSLVSRRIDYVKNNVSTMEKRLHAAQAQLNALDSEEQLPLEPTADFPMREIIEELDENGEVISGTTATPGDQASDLLEILRKAGVKDIPDAPKTNESTAVHQSSSQESAENDDLMSKDENEGHNSALNPAVTPVVSAPPETNEIASTLHNEPTTVDKERPVVDVDESPDDAKLRREMIRYSLDEVGAVVAELELDEDASDISLDDEYDSYTYDDDDEDEEEDEYGRSTRRVLDEDYHRQMRELEAKLNARGMWNVGKDIESLPEVVKEELNEPSKVRVEKTPNPVEEPTSRAKPKKKVAFADDLDIAPASMPPAAEAKKATIRQSDVPVLSDSIVERTESVEKNSVPSDKPKKASRFKSVRNITGNNVDGHSTSSIGGNVRSNERPSQHKIASSPAPSLPLFPARPSEPKPFSQPISDIIQKPPAPSKTEGKIIADTLVERDTSKGTAMAPEPDDIDEQLHRKEIATEFYTMRNRMIQRNGGFVDNEPETVPIEAEDAPRISKFRAARLR